MFPVAVVVDRDVRFISLEFSVVGCSSFDVVLALDYFRRCRSRFVVVHRDVRFILFEFSVVGCSSFDDVRELECFRRCRIRHSIRSPSLVQTSLYLFSVFT